MGIFEKAFKPSKIRVLVLHKQTGLGIYKGNITSLAVVKDEFVIVTTSDTANGFGVKVPSSS